MFLFTAFLPESSVNYAYTAGLLTYSDIAPSQQMCVSGFSCNIQQGTYSYGDSSGLSPDSLLIV